MCSGCVIVIVKSGVMKRKFSVMFESIVVNIVGWMLLMRVIMIMSS